MFECIDRARTAHYKLTSTVILRLSTASDALGDMDLSGNMTRQIEQDMPVKDDSSHIVNIGKLVEDMELKMRNLLRTRMKFISHYTGIADGFVNRGGLFRKSKRCCGRPSKYILPCSSHCPSTYHVAGIPPLTEANREKATHQEMINSMKR